MDGGEDEHEDDEVGDEEQDAEAEAEAEVEERDEGEEEDEEEVEVEQDEDEDGSANSDVPPSASRRTRQNSNSGDVAAVAPYHRLDHGRKRAKVWCEPLISRGHSRSLSTGITADVARATPRPFAAGVDSTTHRRHTAAGVGPTKWRRRSPRSGDVLPTRH